MRRAARMDSDSMRDLAPASFPNLLDCSAWDGHRNSPHTAPPARSRPPRAGSTGTQYHRVPTVSSCPVQANNVPAEWFESAIATVGQETYIYFHQSRRGQQPNRRHHGFAQDLAVATGARVFAVACRRDPSRPRSAVEDGIAAYAWLLGEGVDLETTAFIGGKGRDCLGGKVLQAARDRGLPVPLAGLGFFLRAGPQRGVVCWPYAGGLDRC
jgi:acetyl esterase/lipase